MKSFEHLTAEEISKNLNIINYLPTKPHGRSSSRAPWAHVEEKYGQNKIETLVLENRPQIATIKNWNFFTGTF